jgi:hypothetical protein
MLEVNMKSTEYMNFGKHEGEHISEVPGEYLVWVVDNVAHKLGIRRETFIKSSIHYLAARAELEEKERKREERREAIREERAKSEWVGEVGERREFHIKVVFTKTYDSHFGTGVLVIALDPDGNTIKTMGTAAALWNMARGEEYIVTGTVKAHETWDGAKNTMITRVAMVEELALAA